MSAPAALSQGPALESKLQLLDSLMMETAFQHLLLLLDERRLMRSRKHCTRHTHSNKLTRQPLQVYHGGLQLFVL